MKGLFPASRNRIVPAGAVLAAAIVLLAPCVAQATPYVVKLTQQGNNVVAVGSGSIDVTGLTLYRTVGSTGSGLIPNQAEVDLGPAAAPLDFYTGFAGPTSFGSGSETDATSGTGVPTGIVGSASAFGEVGLALPFGYVSDTALSNSAIWDNASFASLGVTPGIYTWTWGTATDQSFTLDAFTSVPEPAALGMLGFGLLLVGGFVTLRRRQSGST